METRAVVLTRQGSVQAPPDMPFRFPAGWAVTLAVVWWSLGAVGINVGAIVTGVPALGRFASHLWPPDVSIGFLRFLMRPLWETAALSLAGLALAIALACPLALGATSTLWTTGAVGESGSPVWLGHAVYALSRSLLNFMRAVPDLAWALVFVAAVGLGPVPALLALGLSYGGMLGKIYAEILESVDPAPGGALHAAGASRAAIVLYALLPQAWPQLLSYTLYSWECCMRAAAVMGFVGAGGIGYQIDLSMRMFDYGQVATLLIALLGLIALVDTLSFAARRLLLPAQAPRRPGLLRIGSVGVLVCAGALLATGLWANRSGLALVLTPASAAGMARFARGFFPPDLAAADLAQIPRLTVETLAVSIAGTALGVAIAASLCLPAARTLTLDAPFGRRTILDLLSYNTARLVLNALRAVPEVVWALIFVLAVGLGPLTGALALGVHTGGVLGKLFAEALEDVDRRPVEALVAVGASRTAAVAFAALPLAMPVMASYTLLRWDMNLRVAAILGFVGAGGLGQAIWVAINLGFYDHLATLVLTILALVTACDRLSAFGRRRFTALTA